MHSKIMGLIAVMGMMSSVAFAEPAIQPGDTLESLSKARITTNVINTQAATPTPQTSVASNTTAEVKVEDIDPIIEEKAAEVETVKVAVKPVTQATVEAVVAPVASSELIVSVDDIDVAHPTE
ncbi:hypothetical protein [Acinetobacter sp. ABJ-A23_2]|uniref:hypothetical protein n=1 Tax=Acinetobacter sp. ABJ-A23_2 TaxID=3376991 RepID=UPI0037C5B671